MKHLFYLIICITCFAPLKAQKEFAPIGAEWYFSKSVDFVDEGYVKFKSEKDTIIENKTCKKLSRIYFTAGLFPDTLAWASEYVYQSGDSVFIYDDNKFNLLYNFGLNKEDTLNFYAPIIHACGEEEQTGAVIIDSVYSKNINGNNLTVTVCSPINSSVWSYSEIINNIGGNCFYPHFVNTCGIMDYSGYLGGIRCYSDGKGNSYNFQNRPCDTLIRLTTGVTDKEELAIPLQLYPSVTKQHIVVKVADNVKGAEPYQIINQAGAIVRNGKITESKSRIDISDLDAGVYYFVLDKMYDKPQSFIKQ